MDKEERLSRIALTLIPGLGQRGASSLVEGCGGAREAFAAGPEIWKILLKQAPQPVLNFLKKGPPHEEAEKLLALCSHKGIRILMKGEDAYPEPLLALPDAPLLVYARGPLTLGKQLRLGMVGTRHPTPGGRWAADHFGREAADAGMAVVSGLAAGVDAAAHQAVKRVHGQCIAVVGTGLDIPYPAENRLLWEAIASDGLLLSERPPGAMPMRYAFPRRNRLLAALSHAVLVVEAGLRSGALITADWASQLGIPVLAVPGSATEPQAAGCLELIRKGAALARNLRDVWSELEDAQRPPSTTRASTLRFNNRSSQLGLAVKSRLGAKAKTASRVNSLQQAIPLAPGPGADDFDAHPATPIAEIFAQEEELDWDVFANRARLQNPAWISPGALHAAVMEWERLGQLARRPGGRLRMA